MVSPLRGKVSVGMKCQCSRSSDEKSKVACFRCSGVRLARNFVAAAAMADDDRSAPVRVARANTATIAAATHRRGENQSAIVTLLIRAILA